MLTGKRILLGVASSVALYKSLDLVRALKREGADVHVVMTPHATQLISPLLMQAVSGNRVWWSFFDNGILNMSGTQDSMPHVGFFRQMDAVLLAPATASLIGRYAMGLANDLLTTTLLATEAPVLLAPAMNTSMWEHPLVQANVDTLQSIGVTMVGPAVGELVCGIYGAGHLADLRSIVWSVARAVTPQTLQGKRILISSGRTEESLDPIRVLTNRSSGRMGLAFAQMAFLHGAEVTVVSGLSDVEYPEGCGLNLVHVRSAEQMKQAVMAHFPESDLFVSAAAVGDFRPAQPSQTKLKKEERRDHLTLSLTKNPDILQEVTAQRRPDQRVIGFALETDQWVERGRDKLLKKGLDLIIANGPDVLGVDQGLFHLIDARDHRSLTLTKRELSRQVLLETMASA